MQATASTPILRSAARIIVVAGLIAGAIGIGAWYLLPYEAWKAETFPERFALWEGVLWALGATGTLFGVAALFNATDLYCPRLLEQVQQQASDARRGRTLYSELPTAPWMLLACSLGLIVAAVVGRSVLLGA